MLNPEIIRVATATEPFRFLQTTVRNTGVCLEIANDGRSGIDYESPDGRMRLCCAWDGFLDAANPASYVLYAHFGLQDENEVGVWTIWDQENAIWTLFWDTMYDYDDISTWLCALLDRHGLSKACEKRSYTNAEVEAFIQDCARTYLETLPIAN